MPTETNCPHCGESLTVPDDPQGRLARCAHCEGIFPLAEALAVRAEPVAPAATLQSTAPGSREADGGDSPAPSSVATGDDASAESAPAASAAQAPAAEGSAAAGPSPDATPGASPPSASIPVAAIPVAPAPQSMPAPREGAPAGWHLRIPEGRTYGPVDRAKLDRWLHEGRIDADCSLRQGDQGPWIPAATLFPQLEPGPNDQPEVRRPTSLPQTAYAPRPQSPTGHAPHSGAGASPQYAAGVYQASAYGAGQPVRRTATSDSYSASPYGAPANATGSPFRGPQVQPHRGEVVFLLGLFGLLLGCPVFSGAAWYLGGVDLRAMNLGLMHTGGRGMTTFGYVLGIVVSCFWIVAVLIAMLVISVSILTQ